jgi:hypothetical protein
MSAHLAIVPHHSSEIVVEFLVAGMVGKPTIPATRKTKYLSHFDSGFIPSELQVENDGANLTHGDATFAKIPPSIHST